MRKRVTIVEIKNDVNLSDGQKESRCNKRNDIIYLCLCISLRFSAIEAQHCPTNS